MTRFKILGAAAVLSMTMATPLFGQATIQEPGALSFYRPNADVLNGGRPTPAASGALASVPLGASDAYAAMGATRTARLALSVIVPTTRLQVPSSAMMVTGIGASEAAREDERGGRSNRPFRDLPFTIGA
jgi:hypothetical protein